MPVTLQRNESRWLMSLEGQITVASAAEIKTRLLEWLAAGKDLEMNLDHVEEIDITVLQLLWAAAREATSTGVSIEWRASEAAADTMRDAGFSFQV